MTLRSMLVLVWFVACSAPAFANADDCPRKTFYLTGAVEMSVGHLDNGVEIIVTPDNEAPRVIHVDQRDGSGNYGKKFSLAGALEKGHNLLQFNIWNAGGASGNPYDGRFTLTGAAEIRCSSNGADANPNTWFKNDFDIILK